MLNGLVDVHCHLVALPVPGNGCFIAEKQLRGPLGRLIARLQGLPVDDPARANALYREKLLASLAASKRAKQAVLLGLDGVYDGAGRLDEARTSIVVSSGAVFEACAASGGRLLPGPSINPRRRDALDELERCSEGGAALIKFLPNAQGFDPGAPQLKPFYRRLAELRLPLLSHIGIEFSVGSVDQTVGEPGRLRPALEEGVTVIAAHGCSAGGGLREPHLPTLLEFAARFPRFFVDLSAMTLPTRAGMLLRLRRHPEVFDRLLFGTDYPLPVLWPGSNYFDRQAAALEAAGVLPLADAAKVLRLPA